MACQRPSQLLDDSDLDRQDSSYKDRGNDAAGQDPDSPGDSKCIALQVSFLVKCEEEYMRSTSL